MYNIYAYKYVYIYMYPKSSKPSSNYLGLDFSVFGPPEKGTTQLRWCEFGGGGC